MIRFYKTVREVSPTAVQHMYISNNWNIRGLEHNADLAACGNFYSNSRWLMLLKCVMY